MYTTLPFNFGLRVLLIGFGLLMLVTMWLVDSAGFVARPLQTLGFAATVYAILLYLLLGTSSYCSPWRYVWRKFPILNRWLYPDLNGVWLGSTCSNWPVIARTREAAKADGALDLGELAQVPLLEGAIALELKASLFRISLRSKLENTEGTSSSFVTRAEKCPDGSFALSYLYRQDTPDPVGTDEGSHVGAATLRILVGTGMKLEGEYWTRRKWREGMNTAGRISLLRATPQHAQEDEDLLEFARCK